MNRVKIYKTLVYDSSIPKGSLVEVYKIGTYSTFYVLYGTKANVGFWSNDVVPYIDEDVVPYIHKNIIGGKLL